MIKEFNVGVSDKIIMPWLAGRKYLDCSDEGEAIAIGAGHYLATGRRANVFMSGDGFMNALNFFSSWIMVDPKIEMNIFISSGRQELPHVVVSNLLEDMLELLNYDIRRIFIKIIKKPNDTERIFIKSVNK